MIRQSERQHATDKQKTAEGPVLPHAEVGSQPLPAAAEQLAPLIIIIIIIIIVVICISITTISITITITVIIIIEQMVTLLDW